jgi:hypothetical protein
MDGACVEIAKMMNLFFYIARPGGREEQLLGAVAPLVSRGSLEVFRNFRSLVERVRRPKESFSAAVIFNPANEDLRKLISIRDFLEDTRVLLILPDQEEETIALAHRIFPTYITYLDGDTSGVVSVLKRLAEAQGDKASPGHGSL